MQRLEAARDDTVGYLVEGVVGIDVGTVASSGGSVFVNDIAVEEAVVVGNKLVGHVGGLCVVGVVLCSGERGQQEQQENSYIAKTFHI